MKTSTAVAKTPMVLALRDSLSGKEVEVPRDAKGNPDFFVAGLTLRRLHEPKSKAAAPAPDKALQAAEANLKSSKKDYAKAAKEYNAAMDAYEKARTATAQARAGKAKPGTLAKLEAAEKKAREKYQNADALLCAYRKGYAHDRGVYEKLLKARHRAPAYDYATGSYRAFGKKIPGGYGAALLVAIPPKPKIEAPAEKKPKPIAATKPKKAPNAVPVKTAKAPSVAPKKFAPSSAKAPSPVKPAPVAVPKPTVVPSAAPVAKAPEPKIPAAAKPAEGTESLAKVSPGLGKEHPLPYSQSEVKDGNIVIHTTEGKTITLPQATSKYQSHGGGLGSITTADGQVFWFRYVPPVEDLGGDAAPKIAAKTVPPAMPKTPDAPVAKLETPVAAKTETPAAPASSGPTSFTGVSDAEAANYSIPVEGYPTAKAPLYLWKHKSQDEFLAVFEGKRLKLNKAQFLSLDKGAHPEFYAKSAKPLPKMPPPMKASDPDF